ncbi:MAG: hypothetical protein K2X29_13465 [Candidatus Obscuribacterales bacterium]|nr:hypothetical protein [Candidatus Obscuribacterales bacterium]
MKNIPKGNRYREKKTQSILPINFELRKDEIGTSVWQRKLITPEKVLSMTKESFRGQIASARVQSVTEEGFVVLDVPDEIHNIAGHAEVRSDKRSLLDLGDRQLLCEIFHWHSEPNDQAGQNN